MKEKAALLFVILNTIVILFQIALAFGAPWGAASMGGKFPGKYPVKMRVVALFNACVLGFISAIVLSKGGLAFGDLQPFSEYSIWLCVVFFALGSIMNTVTPSKIERIWAPVAFIQFICCLVLAMVE